MKLNKYFLVMTVCISSQSFGSNIEYDENSLNLDADSRMSINIEDARYQITFKEIKDCKINAATIEPETSFLVAKWLDPNKQGGRFMFVETELRNSVTLRTYALNIIMQQAATDLESERYKPLCIRIGEFPSRYFVGPDNPNGYYIQEESEKGIKVTFGVHVMTDSGIERKNLRLTLNPYTDSKKDQIVVTNLENFLYE